MIYHKGGFKEMCNMDLIFNIPRSTSFLFTCVLPRLTPGHNCEFLPCEASNPCENGAVCVEELDQDHFPLGFRCHCRRGFTGPRCEINVDECSSSPCLHGFCYDGMKQPIMPARLIADTQNGSTHTLTHTHAVNISNFVSLTYRLTGSFQSGHRCS